ncbi:dimethyladenosine transferase 1, mitochondrial [Diprion similis]|uniref:dimethyladenosine transferase 1, mitochondrial n=1 Tax=Diprion similis TaxID=362088 RepID=UPI001EF76C64|nr:dimethyladenosine transferase 1, mitochondrial [Diprion similis]
MSVLRLPPLPSIRDLVKLYRLQARKQLSQNFLMDERLTDKIIKMAGRIKDAHILEVGPGPGGLTRSIMRKYPQKLIVVEKDDRFLPTLQLLQETFQNVNGEMEIIIGDILKVNLNVFPECEKKSWDDISPRIHLIGNLPFSLSTHLIIVWLKAISEKSGPWAMGRTRMTLTFQKEVAERLVSEAYARDRCRLSVMAQAWTKPTLKFIIPGKAFVPQPDVDVGVVTFTPLVQPRTNHEFELFEKVTRHIFSFRQKYVVKCTETLFPLSSRKELGMMMVKLAEVDPTTRPFMLEVAEIDRLCTAYKYLCEKHPGIESFNYRASNKLLSHCHTSDVTVEEVSANSM